MVPKTLKDIELAMGGAWSRETCDPVDKDYWSAQNPSRGQCGVTALVLQDLLGGDLLIASVLHSDGSHQGYHYWNRLGTDCEVDLTREQFTNGEIVQAAEVSAGPQGGRGAVRHSTSCSAIASSRRSASGSNRGRCPPASGLPENRGLTDDEQVRTRLLRDAAA
jgi:hypothetical protein